jgi:hypothetical protein
MGKGEAHILRRIRHRRNEQRRIIDRNLHPLVDRDVTGAPIRVVGADHVGEEQRVELAALEQTGEIHPGVEVVVVGLTRVRARPLAVMNV